MEGLPFHSKEAKHSGMKEIEETFDQVQDITVSDLIETLK